MSFKLVDSSGKLLPVQNRVSFPELKNGNTVSEPGKSFNKFSLTLATNQDRIQ